MVGRHQDLPTGLEQVTALTKKSHEETGRENVVKGKELLASQGQFKDKVDRGETWKDICLDGEESGNRPESQ